MNPTEPAPNPEPEPTPHVPAPTGAIDCPRCRRRTALRASCSTCGTDLQPLLRTAALADEYFNRALSQARRLQWQDAAEHLAVVLALRPSDVDALVLLAKVRHRQGRRRAEEAKSLWQRALELDPDRQDARAALELLALAPVPRRRTPSKSQRRAGRGR
jgi:tetratricopeptide (TPR) repeat protein